MGRFKRDPVAVAVAVLFLMLAACGGPDRDNERGAYTFLVAGHAYGDPIDYTSGLHPPLRALLTDLSAAGNAYSFMVLTGDVVPRGTEQNWLDARRVLDSLGMPVYIAPGNHDMIDTALYRQYGGPLYQSFLKEGDLHIVLNSNPDWNIEGAQLAFLKSELEGHSGRVFLYVHHVLWLEEEGPFSAIKPNWTEGRDSTWNFHDEVLPLLQKHPDPVYLFAGDVGAQHDNATLYYLKDGDLHFIASGMGNGRDEHVLEVRVDGDAVDLFAVPLTPGQDPFEVVPDN